MSILDGLGDWPLVVTVGGLLALHFVNERRIKALERELGYNGEDETDDGDGVDGDLCEVLERFDVEAPAPSEGAPAEPESRLN